jgi:hypothetical protein
MRRLLRLAVLEGLAALVAWLGPGRRRDAGEPVRAGGHLDIARCPLHGIAYDRELEVCPDCARLDETEHRAEGVPAASGAP